jgi:hypothetical protein
VAVFCLYKLEAAMSDEWKKARAQYLNGLAVAIVSLAISAMLAGAPWWVLPAAVAVSLTLHWAAVWVVR